MCALGRVRGPLQAPAVPSAISEAEAEQALLPLSTELALHAAAPAHHARLLSFQAICVCIRPLGHADGAAGAGVMITLADELSDGGADGGADGAGRWRSADLMLDFGAMPPGAGLHARQLMGVRAGARVECRRAGAVPTAAP
jgi:hypothetical protein